MRSEERRAKLPELISSINELIDFANEKEMTIRKLSAYNNDKIMHIE